MIIFQNLIVLKSITLFPAAGIGFPLILAVSSTVSFMLLMITGALGLITSVVIYFSLRLRKLNRQLKITNSEISYDNTSLKKSNVNLTVERDKIARDLEFSEVFFQSLIESAEDAVSFHNSDGRLEFANTMFFRLLGLDPELKEEFRFEVFIHPDDSGFITARSRSLVDTGSFNGEVRLLMKKGGFVEFSVKSASIYDSKSGLMGHLDIFRDISAQKKTERDLRSAKEDAEASNRLKTTFVANISHEIRTPLNSIIGFSNLLRNDSIDSVIREEYLEQIEFNSERLMNIIGDIIDLSRLESGQAGIKYAEVNVSVLVEDVLTGARAILNRNEKDLELKAINNMPSGSECVYSDYHWLKRVLGHLIENAIKFTIKGAVELNYSISDEKLIFVVKDSGIGIDKKNLSRIFEEFRQVDTGWRRTFEGLGIGLSLAREVLVMLGGEIEVKSEKGTGSEFTVTIPYKGVGSASRDSRKKSSGDKPKWNGKSCLVVEDNKDVMSYLLRILSETGIEIFTAGSGEEALAIIEEDNKFDVIILDMQLPGMSGLDVVAYLKEVGNNVPIVAQTAFVFEDDKKFILDAGCDACLLKPVRREHLYSSLTPLLEKVI